MAHLCLSSVSMFKNLLQHSRVVSLPEIKTKVAGLPSEQVIKTTSASHHRRNWGLKHALPSKAKSVLIAHSGLDNSLGMPEVEYDAAHARRVQKFAETGASVGLVRSHSEIPSLFSVGPRPTQKMRDLSPKQRQRIFKSATAKRLEYARYVTGKREQSAQNQHEHYGPPGAGFSVTNPQMANSFMGFDSSNSFTTGDRPSTAIGLSYALKGTTQNTRHGLLVNQRIPGRVLPFVSQELASAAGFVGSVSNVANDKNAIVSHEVTKPMYVTSAEADVNGTVRVRFAQEEKRR